MLGRMKNSPEAITGIDRYGELILATEVFGEYRYSSFFLPLIATSCLPSLLFLDRSFYHRP